MNKRLLAVALSALLLTGCPPTPRWSGRYHIVNNTSTTISDLTVSVGYGNDKTWDQTLPGQGWIHPNLGAEFLIVSWKDETGDHREQLSFGKKFTHGSKADLHVELKPGGIVTWRTIDAPPKEGSAEAVFFLVLLYVFYCLVACLVIGVPLALGSLIAYGLFRAIRAGIVATVQGLRGDRSVLQFSIREIVLLTTVVALGCGWIVVLGIKREDILAANKRYTDAELLKARQELETVISERDQAKRSFIQSLTDAENYKRLVEDLQRNQGAADDFVETIDRRDPETGNLLDRRIFTWRWQKGGRRDLIKEQNISSFPGMAETSTHHYLNGKNHGPYSVLDEKGESIESGQYVNGELVGTWHAKHGITHTIANYRESQLHGLLEVKSRSSEKTIITATFDMGELKAINGKPLQEALASRLISRGLDIETATALGSQTQCDFQQERFSNVLVSLSQRHNIPIGIDRNRVVDPNVLVSLWCHKIDVGPVLTLLTTQQGLDCDYRFGSLWITTAENVRNWRDSTGIADIKPPKRSVLEQIWNEPVVIAPTTSPLPEVLTKLAHQLEIQIDVSRIASTAFSPRVWPNLNHPPGRPFRHALGILLDEADCHCRLEGETIVILPSDQ